jgi:hypothetical protein
MKAHALKVNGYGFRHRDGDPAQAGKAFTNEVALFKMSNGATVRIAEMRETPGSIDPAENEMFRVMGTLGTFSANHWHEIKRPDYHALDYGNLPKPTQVELSNEEMFAPLPIEVQENFKRAMHTDKDESEIKYLDFTPTGHGGSHPYLVHEFIDAVANNRQPAINIWEAVRYMAMGISAHKSALRDGETVEVPDWGDAPN